MNKNRIGKDLLIRWAFHNPEGGAFDLTRLDLRIFLLDYFQRRVEVTDYIIEDTNKIVFTFAGTAQKVTGTYSLQVWVNKDKVGQSVVDACGCFELVPCTHMESDMERAGYDLATQLKVSASSNAALKLEMERVMADAYFYAAGINHKGDRLEQVKRVKRNEIQRYDQSDAVNQFTLVSKQIWLPKETRVGLVNSISIEKAAGKPNTVLWFDGVRYEIPIEQALKILGALEMYALECYNVTHKHLSDVDKLLSVDAVNGYDYKSGYPEKLNFDSMDVKAII